MPIWPRPTTRGMKLLLLTGDLTSPTAGVEPSELDNRPPGDLAARQCLARLVDVLQRIASGDHQVQWQHALLEPAHQQRKIAIGRRTAARRATVDLAAEQHVHGQSWRLTV